MTPAELMACTKDVSRVAGGEGKKAVTCKHRHQSRLLGMKISHAAKVREEKKEKTVCAKGKVLQKLTAHD